MITFKGSTTKYMCDQCTDDDDDDDDDDDEKEMEGKKGKDVQLQLSEGMHKCK